MSRDFLGRITFRKLPNHNKGHKSSMFMCLPPVFVQLSKTDYYAEPYT